MLSLVYYVLRVILKAEHQLLPPLEARYLSRITKSQSVLPGYFAAWVDRVKFHLPISILNIAPFKGEAR